MNVKDVKKKLGSIVSNNAVQPGDIFGVYMAGIFSYALCTFIEPAQGPGGEWYNIRFLVLHTLPPTEYGWTVEVTNLAGTEFTIKGNPICIIPLDLPVVYRPPSDGVVKPLSWEEMIDGPKEPTDSPGGGCPNCPAGNCG